MKHLLNASKLATVVGLLFVALIVTSCDQSQSTSDNTPTPTPTEAEQPPDDQTDDGDTGDDGSDGTASGGDTTGVVNPTSLVIDNISQPRSLDPAWSFFTADSAILRQIYEHLVDYKDGSISEFVAELAAEVPTVDNGGVSEDLLTYTFTLRDDVTFWDGSPLSCADVEYSLERNMAMDRSGGGSFLLLDPLTGTTTTRDADGNLKDGMAQKIADAVECDGNQVTFHLQSPFPPFLQVIAHASYGAVYAKAFAIEKGATDNADPQAFLEAENNPTVAADTALFNTAMGSGPYTLAAWDQSDEKVILVSYDDYRMGTPTLKNVVYSNVPEFNTRLLRLQRGDADVSTLTERSQAEQIKSNAPAGVRLIEYLPGFTTETLHFNMDINDVDVGNQFTGSGQCDGNGIPADFFQDINIRKAFVVSFDQATFISDFLQGAGVVAATPVPPQIEFVDPSIAAPEFDLDAAEAFFKDAQCDGQSVWDTGFSFTAVFNEGNSRRQAAFEQLEYHIESLNTRRQDKPPFDVTVISQPGPVVLNNVFQQEILPMYAFGWSPDFIDIDNWIRQWMDGSGGTWANANNLNVLGEVAAEWTTLLNEAIRTLDPDKRRTDYAKLQQGYVDYAVAITLPNRTLDNIERSWVNGNYYNPGSASPSLPPNVYQLSKIVDGQANMVELEPYGPTVTEF